MSILATRLRAAGLHVFALVLLTSPSWMGAGCSGGTDTDVSGPVDTGGPDSDCGGSATKCGDACVDLVNDLDHCGACANACPQTMICSIAQCDFTCNGGTDKCGSTCVNLSSNLKHCGACDVECAAGEVCSGGACALSCQAGLTECAGTCVNLLTDYQHCGDCEASCMAGEVCSAGSCQLTCQAGLTDCNGTCVSLQSSNQNCGACDNPCASGHICSSGSCQVTCQAGQTSCNDVCVNTGNDDQNCGACGNACLAGQLCSDGICAVSCQAGQTSCNGTCAALNDDNQNCGSCGNACSAGYLCTGGVCGLTCQSGLTDCGGACVNTESDLQHCGVCGQACGAGQVCSDGACVASCGAGLTDCSGSCVSTSNDPEHCGGCGAACAGSQICQAGACVDLQPTNDECTAAIAITLGSGTTMITGNTTGATDSAGSCSNGKDVQYSFTLGGHELVYVDSFGSGFDTMIGLSSSCVAAPTCNDDACSLTGSQLTAVLSAGTYFLHVDGNGGDSGNFTLRIQHIPVNGASGGTIPAGSFTLSGNTTDSTSSQQSCAAKGPDNWYSWVTCPSYGGGAFTASTCGAASYDTVLALRNGGGLGGGCNKDACGQQSNLSSSASAGAGIHVLYVDGAMNSAGAYTVTGTRP
jgi:hypothetical protein